MQLSLQTFQQLLQRMSASVQSSASQLIDLSVGSLLRAILEANASIGLWIQWLIVQTLAMTRAATSTGTDLDTWMADFMLVRLPAATASGEATFTRLLTTQPILVPAGTQVKTTTGNVAFVVSGDTSNPAWQPSSNSYLLPSGAGSIDLPVVAQMPGSIGNVSAGTVSVIASPLPGIDLVSNALAFAGGCDAESDAKFRARFRAYINSRSLATLGAVGYAISSLQQSLRYKVFENTDASNNWLPGHFVVVVDDGAGNLSSSLTATVYAAVDKVRPIGSTFSIQAPAVVPVTIAISLATGQPALNSSIVATIVTAVTNYIAELPVGSPLMQSRIIEIAYRTGHLSEDIASVSINGLSADLASAPNTVLQVRSVTVQ